MLLVGHNNQPSWMMKTGYFWAGSWSGGCLPIKTQVCWCQKRHQEVKIRIQFDLGPVCNATVQNRSKLNVLILSAAPTPSVNEVSGMKNAQKATFRDERLSVCNVCRVWHVFSLDPEAPESEAAGCSWRRPELTFRSNLWSVNWNGSKFVHHQHAAHQKTESLTGLQYLVAHWNILTQSKK